MQNTVTDNGKAFPVESARRRELEEMGEFSRELKRLLIKHSALDKEDIHREIEILELWMESYCQNPSAVSKITAAETAKLAGLRDRLKLAAEESQRLESEGGAPVSKEQADRIEELLRAARHMETLLADIERRNHFADKKREEEHAA